MKMNVYLVRDDLQKVAYCVFLVIIWDRPYCPPLVTFI